MNPERNSQTRKLKEKIKNVKISYGMNYLGFWKKLKKPIFALAPMADVTDSAFRQIITKYGKPDVFWTEFVSADGLCSSGRDKLLIDLEYSKNEHPIVAQIFGAKIDNIKETATLCKKLNFDGIDINMGCPDRSIEKQGAGAAMIKNSELAGEIIKAAKEGAKRLPISVKTRIGYNPPGGIASRAGKKEMDTWIKALLEEDIAVLTVHLRTRKEMSNVPAHWELMKRIVEIRNEMKKETLILGNGDVIDIDDARKKCEETGCDGVMFGRAVFGNPFLFTNKNVLGDNRGQIPSLEKKLKVMIEHTHLFEKMFIHPAKGGSASGRKNFVIMKKHYKAYVSGWRGAKELRMKLMEAKNSKEIEKITNDFLSKI